MTPLTVLSSASLAVGSLFAGIGLLSGDQWVQLVAYVLGLHAAGTAGVTVAKPAGEYLAASARKILSRDRESG
jgi:hypothetical protein